MFYPLIDVISNKITDINEVLEERELFANYVDVVTTAHRMDDGWLCTSYSLSSV